MVLLILLCCFIPTAAASSASVGADSTPGSTRQLQALAGNTCVDDPSSFLSADGLACPDIVALGCDADLHGINALAPAGTLISAICPVACGSCPCMDDPTGALAQMGITCEALVPLGCNADLHNTVTVVPAGTPIALACPQLCDYCGVPALDIFTVQQAMGIQKLGAQLGRVPDGRSVVEALVEAIGESPAVPNKQCLWSDDYLLRQLRVKRVSALDLFDASRPSTSGQELFDLLRHTYSEIGYSELLMVAPGLGVYHGADAAAEYTMVTQPEFNGNFWHQMKAELVQARFSHNDQIKLDQHVLGAWASYTIFQVGEQNTTFTFRPCSLRVDLYNVHYNTETVETFIDRKPSNSVICERIQSWCTGPNQQYSSMAACVAHMDALPAVDPACTGRDNGVDYALQGNTSACKFLHHFMAQSTPETHCFHAGPGMPDANGHIKCAPSDCLLPTPTAAEDYVCSPSDQADLEQRIVQVLPRCLNTVRTRICEPECVLALRQFRLLPTQHVTEEGVFQAPNHITTLQPMCTCRNDILASAFSTVLAELELDPVVIFGGCAEGLIGQSFNFALARQAGCIVDDVEQFTVQNETDQTIVRNVLRRIADIRHASPGPGAQLEPLIRSILLEDEGFCEEFLGQGVKGRLLQTALIAPGTQYPFSHGKILQSHADVTDALSAIQNRSVGAFTAQPLMGDVLSPHMSVYQSTGTPEHQAARQLVYNAFPELTVNLGQTIDAAMMPSIPAALREAFFASSTDSPSAEMATEYLIYAYARCLLIGATEQPIVSIPDDVMQSLKYILLVQHETFERSHRLHQNSGLFLPDAVRMARESVAVWLRSEVYTQDRLASLATTAGLETKTISLALADEFYQGLSRTLSPISSFFERFAEQPCVAAAEYRAAPLAYWLEHLRLEGYAVASIMSSHPNGSIVLSLVAANHDAAVFPEPEMFDPTRSNLNHTVTFNALEGEIQAGAGGTLARSCPAHDFVLRFYQALADRALEDIPVVDVEKPVGRSAEGPAPSSSPVACADDPNGDLAAFGGCATVVSMGCDVDLNTVDPAAPVGTIVSGVCPVSCGVCTSSSDLAQCIDDPLGVAIQACTSCRQLITELGCHADLHSEYPELAPMGTPAALICPATCGDCGAGVLDVLTSQEAQGVEKLGAQLNSIPATIAADQAAADALAKFGVPSSSSCAWMDDSTLLQLRISRLANNQGPSVTGFHAGGAELFDAYRKSFSFLGSPKFTLTAPGLGSYHGPDSIAEYLMILRPEFNGGLVHVLAQALTRMRIDGIDQFFLSYLQLGGWSNYTRLSVGEFNYTYTFAPCSLRMDMYNARFDDLSVQLFTSESPPHEVVCERIQSWCTGPNQQYDSIEACVTFLDALPVVEPACTARDNGVDYAFQGNTSSCRFLHHMMAQSTPETHCFHAGPGIPDANGHVKCAASDCLPPVLQEPSDYTCSIHDQVEFEHRLVEALPYCLESVQSTICFPECIRALRQFHLLPTDELSSLGEYSEPDFVGSLQPMCTCRQSALNTPMSIVLQHLQMDPVLIFGGCAQGIDYLGFDFTFAAQAGCNSLDPQPAWTQDGSNEDMAAAVLRGVVASSASRSSNPQTVEPSWQQDVLLADQLFCETVLGGPSQLLSTIQDICIPPVQCPLSHGPVVQSYAEVVAALSSIQYRNARMLGSNPDIPSRFVAPGEKHTAPEGIASEFLPCFQTTNTPRYAAGRQAALDTFPVLSVGYRESIDPALLTPPPYAVLAALEKSAVQGTTGNPSQVGFDNDRRVKTQFAQHLVDVFAETLLLPSINVPEDVKAAMLLYAQLPKLSLSRKGNVHSGQQLTDTMRVLRLQVGQWLVKTLGDDKLDAIVAGMQASHDEGTLILADMFMLGGLENFGFQNLIDVFPKLLQRAVSDPCVQIPLFRENPFAYITEHLRLEHFAPSFINSLEESVTISYNGDNIQYGSNGSIMHSLYSAHRDPVIFEDPDVFNPRRLNLDRTLSFNAVERNLMDEAPGILSRHNLGRDFFLRVLEVLLKQYASSSAAKMRDLCMDVEQEHQEPTWRLFTCSPGRPCFDHYEAYILLFLVLLVVGGSVITQVFFFVFYRKLQDQQLELLESLAARPDGSGGLPQCEDGDVPTISFTDVTYTVDGTQLLTGVSGVFEPGQLIALMGGSGSGKTTLMDLLTGRRAFGSMSGNIRYNSTELPDAKSWLRKNAGYVLQDDNELARSLTVREVLTFAALLKLPTKESQEERLLHVEEVIDEFGLRSLAEVVVQTTDGGLSGGQRKRLAIAKEMLRSPSIIFLDEPTSGLDSTSTLEVVKCLQHVASTGRIVIASIHQPRVEVFNLASQVYILSRGETMYCGSPGGAVSHFLSAASTMVPRVASNPTAESGVGEQRISQLVRAMEAVGIPSTRVEACLDAGPEEAIRTALLQTLGEFQRGTTIVDIENPADMILDTMLGPHAVAHETLAEMHRISSEQRGLAETDQRALPRTPPSTVMQKASRFATRVWIAEMRAVKLQSTWSQIQVIVVLLLDCLMYGTLYWQQTNFVALSSILFLSLVIGSGLNVAPVVSATCDAVDVFRGGEYSYALMSTPAFLTQQVLHTLTFSVVGSIAVYVPSYWMIFTEHFYDEYIWTLVLIYALTTVTSIVWMTLSIIFTGSSWKMEPVTIMVMGSMLAFLWQTFSDYYIPINDAPDAWRFAFWTNPIYWMYLPMIHINFKGKAIPCASSMLGGCFSSNGDAVLEYHDATELNFARGPLFALIVFSIGGICLSYHALKGHNALIRQLDYNGSGNGGIRQFGKHLSTSTVGTFPRLVVDNVGATFAAVGGIILLMVTITTAMGHLSLSPGTEYDWVISDHITSINSDAISVAKGLVDTISTGASVAHDTPAGLRSQWSDRNSIGFQYQAIDSNGAPVDVFAPVWLAEICKIENLLLTDPGFGDLCRRDPAQLDVCSSQKTSVLYPFYGPAKPDGSWNCTRVLSAAEVSEASAALTDPEMRWQTGWFLGRDIETTGFTSRTRSNLRLGTSGSVAWATQPPESFWMDVFEPKLLDAFDMETYEDTASVATSEGSLRVMFFGYAYRDLNLLTTVAADLQFACGSIMFVLGMLCYHTKSLFLGCCSMLQILLSLPCTMFLYRTIGGISFVQQVHVLSIYLVLGIGADDIFVFFDAWVQAENMPQEISGSKVSKMSYAFQRAGRAMLTTSFTTAVAFLATAASDIMPIAAFGWFAAIAVLMNYVLVMTLFPCVIIIWEKLGSKSCCCCNHTTRTSNRTPHSGEEPAFASDKDDTEQVDDTTPHGLRWQERLFVHTYTPFVSSGARYMCIAFGAMYMLFSGYHALQMEPPVERERNYPAQHMFTRVQAESEEYMSGDLGEYNKVELVWGIDTVHRHRHNRWEPSDRGDTQFLDGFSVLDPGAREFFEDTCQAMRDRTCHLAGCMDGTSKLARPSVGKGKGVICFIDDWRDWYDSKTCNFCRDDPVFAEQCPTMLSSALNQLAVHHLGDTANVTALLSQVGRLAAYETVCSTNLALFGGEHPMADMTLAEACPYSCGACSESTENPICDSTGRVPSFLLPSGQLFVDSLITFRDAPEHFSTYGDRIGVIDGQLRFLVIEVQTTLLYHQQISTVLEISDEFDRFMAERNAVAPPGIHDGFQTGGRAWTWAITRQGLVTNVYQGLSISFPAAFLTLLFVTRNLVVSGFAIVTIAGIVGMVLGMCRFYLGWGLGVAESLAAVIIVGFSVDFTVHFAHMFEESEEAGRVQRMAFAARTMGVTVLMGGLTTIGAGSFLFMCTLVFFYKFAILVIGTIAFSMLAAMFFFMPLLATVGPEGGCGNIDALAVRFQRWMRGESVADSKASDLITKRKTLSTFQTLDAQQSTTPRADAAAVSKDKAAKDTNRSTMVKRRKTGRKNGRGKRTGEVEFNNPLDDDPL